MTLRAGLLAGRRAALAGGVTFAPAIHARLRSLGATVEQLPADALADEAAAAEWARQRAPLHALAIDSSGAFADGGAAALNATLQLCWRAVRAVATGAMLAASDPGRLVLLAPAPNAGMHAQAARAALENLARTLSVEWARFGITAVAIAPGAHTTEVEIAELVAYLLSPAGGYFSGCRFDLGAVAGPAPTAGGARPAGEAQARDDVAGAPPA